MTAVSLKGSGPSLFSGPLTFETSQRADGRFELSDPTRGGTKTIDARTGEAVTDDDNVWAQESDGPAHRGALDAQFALQMTWDFLRDVLARNSIDGKGGALVAKIHVGANTNAGWRRTHAEFGDGNGTSYGPMTTLDIVAHEMMHGLNQHTAKLVAAGQSAALDEGFADVLATGVEWYASTKNPNVVFDWSMGEDTFTPGRPGDAARYLDDPIKNGLCIDHLSLVGQFVDPHSASGIVTNAFYLFANGGQNRTSKARVESDMGIEKGLQIFYRALVHHLPRLAGFADARRGTLLAAEELYGKGSPEVLKLEEAWSAVGVN